VPGDRPTDRDQQAAARGVDATLEPLQPVALAGIFSQAKAGGAGCRPAGPRWAQTIPPSSIVGYDVTKIFWRELSLLGSFIW
jgi:hypothetical protein